MGGWDWTQACFSTRSLATFAVLALATGGLGCGASSTAARDGTGGAAGVPSGGSAGAFFGGGGGGSAGFGGSGGVAGGPEGRPVPRGRDAPTSCAAVECSVQEIATDIGAPGQISVYGDHVYWVSWDANQVMRVQRNGASPPESLTDVEGPMSLDVDDTGVYLAANPAGVVLRLAHDGSTVEDLTTERVDPRSLVLAPRSVVLAQPSGLFTIPRAGGTPSMLFEGNTVYTWSDWRSVFVSMQDGDVFRVPLSGEAPSLLDTYDVEDMASGERYLYVLGAKDGSSPVLFRHPLTGGVAQSVVDAEAAFDGEAAWSVSADTTHVYVTTSDVDRNVGGLYRLPIESTTPVSTSAVVQLLDRPGLRSLALDDEAIYVGWLDSSDTGKILRVEK